MFGKIKDRLKGIFNKTEEIVEENPDEIVEEVKDKPEEKEDTNSKIKNQKSKSNKEKKNKEVSSKNEKIESEKPETPKPKTEQQPDKTEISQEETPSVQSEDKEEKKTGFFGKAVNIIKKKKITEDDFNGIWLELEIFLLEINIAYEIVEKIESKLKDKLIDNSYSRFGLSNAIKEVLVEEIQAVLESREADFIKQIKTHNQLEEGPVKVLVLGVNGTGKTTTIAKVVKNLRDNNLTCVVAAADTFRAAAVEQLDEHSKKLDFKLIKHKDGSDPAAVAYDAIEHAKAKKIDVVLIDTAGRMPNNSNLMLELQKIKKVSKSQMAVFVGDSISGNDLIDQINLFDKGVTIDGVILTKVDTDEKPGSIVTTAYSIEKPIYFLGVGQTYEDLVKFDSKEIAEKLFDFESEE